MSFWRDLVHHPRRLWVRRAVFQVHLWAGVLLSLYLILIALSGSVLVYKDELTRWALPAGLHRYGESQTASPERVMAQFREAEPGGAVSTLQMPSPVLPAFLLQGTDGAGHPGRWIADPVTAAISRDPRSWLDVVHDLHDYLLLPPGWGMQVNAVGAAALLVLALTGMVLWWPGLRVWTRGLGVNWRANWRRINYDLHSAIGFWTLAIVAWWAVSGMYFGWYRRVTAVVEVISPLQGMLTPALARLPAVRGTAEPSLGGVLAAAQAVSPHGRLWSISNPSLQGAECYVLLDRGAPGDFSHRDIVRVRSADGGVLSVWHYGERHSLGDWFLWSMHPLHFGTVWGPAIKGIWALLGVGLAAITVSGLLMYWNRYLRFRWREAVRR